MQTSGITSIINLMKSSISGSIIATTTLVIPILRPDDPCSELAFQVEDRGSGICIWFAPGTGYRNSRLVIILPSVVTIGTRRWFLGRIVVLIECQGLPNNFDTRDILFFEQRSKCASNSTRFISVLSHCKHRTSSMFNWLSRVSEVTLANLPGVANEWRHTGHETLSRLHVVIHDRQNICLQSMMTGDWKGWLQIIHFSSSLIASSLIYSNLLVASDMLSR